ncbi:hypothetical protein RDI58_029893 [Solanum bulbocastanum]|uniref:Seed biotin-containing protein SBP65 n=1 Tax=Solanum bulbocastanum TaxID=147425 RepID=A0AAN8Y0D5_SOLBU
MASEKAKRENVHPAIHIKSVSTAPAVKVGGLEFSSGTQQQQKQKDSDTQRDKHSSHHVDQGIRGEGLGGFKIESHRKEDEEGRVHGGIHPQEAGNKKRAERKKPALTPAAVLTENPDEKAKDFGVSALHDAKESASHGHGAECYNETALGAQAKDTVGHGVRSGSQYVADKAAAAKDTAIEKGAQAKDAVIHGAQIGSEYVVDKARVAKDTALEKGQQAYGATKDTLSSAGQTTMQSAQQAKDYTLQKAGESKDYATEKSKNAAGYIGQKGVEAKDTTVETGKSAVGYAGEAAKTAKDMAEVGALGAAHYTAKGAAAADVVSSAAGYAGEKAVSAKDTVSGAGKSVAEYAGAKLAAAKDYIVSVEEGAADYAGKKKAETERQLEGNSKRESGGEVFSGEKQATEEGKEGGESESKQVFQGHGGGGGGGGVLQAIGETLVGIGKTTTDFVAGGNKQSQTGYQQGSEKRE